MPGNFKNKMLRHIGISAGIFLAAALITLWLASDLNKKSAAIQQQKQEIDLRFRAIESLSSLKQQSKEAARQKLFLETRLPVQDKLINFPKDINNFAKQNNVDVGFSFGREVVSENNQPGNISFTMTAKSAFANWINFIKAIESSQYLVGFDSFNLASDNKEFQSVINGKIFSQ